MTAQIEARIGSSGALLLSQEVPCFTQPLNDEQAGFYGGRHFVCETIETSAARAIASALGWKWIGTEPFSGDKGDVVAALETICRLNREDSITVMDAILRGKIAHITITY